MEDTCVICGDYVPEGSMACINCQKEIMKGDKADLKWNVYKRNMNTNKIEIFNIFDHYNFNKSVKDLLKVCKTKNEFTALLKKELMYYFWSKFEYEITINSFPPKENNEIKIDIYSQIMNNYNIFVDYIWSKKENKISA